ncbi:MAG: hypothetical protein KC621_15605 [Myxococcales bacterium]|nr:hypothetical protein [Myxococcales bacterium]
MTKISVQLVDAELIGGPEATALAKGLEAVYLRCDVGGDLETPRCEAIQDATKEALRDDVVTTEEWAALGGEFPELTLPPEPGPAYDRLRKRVEEQKEIRRNDYARWEKPLVELERRFVVLGWEDIDCDEDVREQETRHRCVGSIGDNAIAVYLYTYPDRSARRRDVDDTYFPGAMDAKDRYLLNVRAYDEGRTKLLAKELGLLADDLEPEVSEKWARRMVGKAVESHYRCGKTPNGFECSGGTEDYRDIVELDVGQTEPDDIPDAAWFGDFWYRSWKDGRYIRLELVDTELSKLRQDELLGARY